MFCARCKALDGSLTSRLNFGRGREISKVHLIHRSVLKRLRHEQPVDPSEVNHDALGRHKSFFSLRRGRSADAVNMLDSPAIDQTTDRRTGPIDGNSPAADTLTLGDQFNIQTDHGAPVSPETSPSALSSASSAANPGAAEGAEADSSAPSHRSDPSSQAKGRGKNKGYLEPKAILPIRWNTTWDQLRRGEEPMVWGY